MQVERVRRVRNKRHSNIEQGLNRWKWRLGVEGEGKWSGETSLRSLRKTTGLRII